MARRKKREIVKDSILTGIRYILDWIDRRKNVLIGLAIVILLLFSVRSYMKYKEGRRVSQAESAYRQVSAFFSQESLPTDEQKQQIYQFFQDYSPSYYAYKGLFDWANYLNNQGELVDITVYQSAISAFDDSFYEPSLTILMAYVYESYQEYGQASALIEGFIQKYPQDHRIPLLLFDLARFKKQQKQDEEAKVLYLQILDQYPDSQWANRSKIQLVSLGSE